ncbi:MAG: DUF4348 domain-containing protein [Bacteroidales bacterium]|nr:DUF4348 domain-containing protein [Bacteroidales bacterium]
MKIKFLLLFFCVLSITISCNSSEKTENNQNDNSNSTIEEDFDAFLQNFSKKPTFQRQRVLFPLDATLLDPSEYSMQTVSEEINYQEWLLLDFSYDSTFATRQMDGYEQFIRVYEDSTIIEHRGIDNGIYANYYFMKKDGKWYLKSFTDTSY